MNKLFLILLTVLIGAQAHAQTCEVDSNLLNYPATVLLSPAPYSPDSPFYNLALACINEPYSQSVTVKVPPSFLITTIDSVVVPTTGGIQNLPAGMSYVCNPPNCVYLPNTLGCILLTGTPNASNMAPDTLDLLISTTIYTPLIDQPILLPVGLAPEDHFYMILNPTGGCASGVAELGQGKIGAMTLVPNPSDGLTRLQAELLESGRYQIRVFDLLGRLQWSQAADLSAGENTVSLSLGHLAGGQYQVVLSNEQGGLTQRLVIW